MSDARKTRRPYRLILDTNTWLELLMSKRRTPGAVLRPMVETGTFRLLFSPELIAEVAEVARRPRLAARIQYPFAPLVDALVERRYAEIIAPTTAVRLCRDPKDDFLLELALDGKAHYLVSNDGDVLALAPVCCGAVILSRSQFREITEAFRRNESPETSI
jgi:uncharacterized protein